MEVKLSKKTIIILLLFISAFSRGQSWDENSNRSYFKGAIFYFPTVFFTMSFNYERQISQYSTLGLSGNLHIGYGEYHNGWIEPFYLTYRQYTRTNRRFFRNFWAGPYLSYIHWFSTNYKGEAYRGEFANAYGLGFVAGRKLYFNEYSRFFIELGGGITFSYLIETNRIACTRTYEFPFRSPRIIILFGFTNKN